MNLLLIGLRGSGKSTLGRLLAAELGAAFVDLDDETPGVLGAAGVREAWDRHGEDGFRKAEVVALARVLREDGRVVALGGGTPTAPMAAELIADERAAGRARVVYLRATPATLRARLGDSDNAHRPSLTGAGVLDEVEQVFARRDPAYLGLADRTLEVDGLTPAAAVDELRRVWRG